MNSGKVYVIVGGQLAMVPEKYVEKLQKREMLVAHAATLKTYINNLSEIGTQLQADVAGQELAQTVRKIISLNRRIPNCVQFV